MSLYVCICIYTYVIIWGFFIYRVKINKSQIPESMEKTIGSTSEQIFLILHFYGSLIYT